jgi:hypothetical protein
VNLWFAERTRSLADKLAQNPKINAVEILPMANSPVLTLNFRYADGTPGNGQATCVLVPLPDRLGLVV